jgi:hypothetical protein
MDPTQQLAQALAVLSLYVLVPLFLVSLPVIYCVWRVLRDLRAIRSGIWHIAYVIERQNAGVPTPTASRQESAAGAAAPRVALSAFGR